MNSSITKLLVNIANKRNRERNNKTLLVDGIEYIVYMDANYFSLVPVSEDLQNRVWQCVSFEDEKAEAWEAKYKSIRVLDWA